MLSDDKNIQTLQQLFADIKDYIELKLKVARLDLVSKVGFLLSLLVLGVVLSVLLAIIVLFLSATAAIALAPHVGGMAGACALVALAYLLIAVVLITKRKAWIQTPLLQLLTALFLNDTQQEKGGKP
ncbi:phage holin family protein [Alloprevotella tannerae]|uniref:Phage holin family protein n=1 Tax=Alloprevotella tannerae TaxID=76122 RepID=A0A929RWB1_9BACT|nr:phage holin family protein [Alloprevotella tannerae]MBF0970460.1 phage holin family protein [Alloprevotella tannerae]